MFEDSIHFLLDYHPEHGTAGDEPILSARGRKALDEICEIVAYMGNSRVFTLTEPEVLNKPIKWGK